MCPLCASDLHVSAGPDYRTRLDCWAQTGTDDSVCTVISDFFGKPAKIDKEFFTDSEYYLPAAKRFKLLRKNHFIHAFRLSVNILCCNGTKSAVLIRCFVNRLA